MRRAQAGTLVETRPRALPRDLSAVLAADAVELIDIHKADCRRTDSIAKF